MSMDLRITTEHNELMRKGPRKLSKAKYSVFLSHLNNWYMLRHVYAVSIMDIQIETWKFNICLSFRNLGMFEMNFIWPAIWQED